MVRRLPFLVLVALAALAVVGTSCGEGEEWARRAPAPPPDPRLERPPGPEPAYVADPRYALFLFGSRAEVPMWAVLDKSQAQLPHYDVLYLDRDADGDLTEPTERYEGTYDERRAKAGMALVISVGDLPVPGTERVHREFVVSTIRKKGRTGIWFRMRWDGKVRVSGGTTVRGDATAWAPGPEAAPVLRPTIESPLSFGLYGWGAEEVRLRIGETQKVYLMAGNPGGGPDTFCPVDETFLAGEGDRIVATLVATDAKGRELRERTVIDGHC